MRILQILRNGVIDSESDGFRHTTYQNEVIKEAIDTIDALTRGRDKLERDARAGRELRNFFGRYYDKNNDPQTLALKSYDTATKETGQ